MAKIKITSADINERNQEFWGEQNQRMQKQMADDAVRDIAFETLVEERQKKMPSYFRVSVEKALEDAERIKRRFIGQQARKGGKAQKEDTLQRLIGAIWKEKHGISSKELLRSLEGRTNVIMKIDEKNIFFKDKHGKIKMAPISGLKDRLHRAKKQAAI